MDFYKGRISKHTLQIALERPQMLPLWIFSVLTPALGLLGGFVVLFSCKSAYRAPSYEEKSRAGELFLPCALLPFETLVCF